MLHLLYTFSTEINFYLNIILKQNLTPIYIFYINYCYSSQNMVNAISFLCCKYIIILFGVKLWISLTPRPQTIEGINSIHSTCWVFSVHPKVIVISHLTVIALSPF